MASVRRQLHEISARFVLFFACLLMPAALSGQQAEAPPTPVRPVNAATLTDALTTVLNSLFITWPADELLGSESIQTVEREFAEAKRNEDKAELAKVLVRLKDPNSEYYNFLEKLAIETLDSDTPGPLQYDPQGKELPQPAPVFLAWLLSRNLSPGPLFSSNAPQAVIQEAYRLRPRSIVLLGAGGDPRAIPVLRRALLSHDFLIEQAGAAGLAEIHDEASIRYIIEAAERAPADAAAAVAGMLLYFDDPEAQQAVRRYVPELYVEAFRLVYHKGDTPQTGHTEAAPTQ